MRRSSEHTGFRLQRLRGLSDRPALPGRAMTLIGADAYPALTGRALKLARSAGPRMLRANPNSDSYRSPPVGMASSGCGDAHPALMGRARPLWGPTPTRPLRAGLSNWRGPPDRGCSEPTRTPIPIALHLWAWPRGGGDGHPALPGRASTIIWGRPLPGPYGPGSQRGTRHANRHRFPAAQRGETEWVRSIRGPEERAKRTARPVRAG